MTLQDQIKNDLLVAMKAQDSETTAALRVIMGEFGRMPSKSLDDNEVVQILKKLYKAEKEVLGRLGDTEDSGFIEVLDRYLPRQVSEADIASWITANIDFSQYGNKMQAMRDIMRHFGSSADGNMVKSILQTRF
jgi:uncharacterized protein YqeY